MRMCSADEIRALLNGLFMQVLYSRAAASPCSMRGLPLSVCFDASCSIARARGAP